MSRNPEDVSIDPQVEPLASRPVGHGGTRVEVDERPAWAVSGFLVVPIVLILLGVGVWQVVLAPRARLTWVVPLNTRRRVSVRVRNLKTSTLKVNDADGNPVEIAAIVVWQVADTAKATFSVYDYENFVAVQAEAALRHVATTHPYDDTTGRGTSLRGSTDTVSDELAHEVAQRIVVGRPTTTAGAASTPSATAREPQAGAATQPRSLTGTRCPR